MTMNDVTAGRYTRKNIFRGFYTWLLGGGLLFATMGMGFFGCDAVVVEPDPELVCRDLIVRSCDSVEIPAEIVTACEHLGARRVAYSQRCPSSIGEYPAEEPQVFVDTCVGIATARGVTLTPLDLQACADELDAWPCSRGDSYTCLGYKGDLLYPEHDKTGTLALGEACFSQVQCASGYCDRVPSWGDCGTCKRGRSEGESCTDATDVCKENLGCSDGICQPPGHKLGEECLGKGIICQRALYCNDSFRCAAYGQAGASCNASTPCAHVLFCQAGVCVARFPDGTNCTDSAMCASGLCDNGVCTAVPPRPTGLIAGQDCSAGSCRDDLWCSKNHVCTVPTHLPEGAACARDDFPTIACENGFYCDETCTEANGCQGTCRRYPIAGEPCTKFVGCGRGTYCEGFDVNDLSKSHCEKLGTKGEACPCAYGLTCLAGVCITYGTCE